MRVTLDSDAFADAMDDRDELKGFREKFAYPKNRDLPLGKKRPYADIRSLEFTSKLL